MVVNTEKPHVLSRWSSFTDERLDVVIPTLLTKVTIYNSTLVRSEQTSLFRAQILANIDVFVQSDPDNPKMITGAELTIDLLEPKLDGSRCPKPRHLSSLKHASLHWRCTKMVQTKKLVHSKSGWNHPLMMVPNLDKITAFMQTHGTAANNATIAL